MIVMRLSNAWLSEQQIYMIAFETVVRLQIFLSLLFCAYNCLLLVTKGVSFTVDQKGLIYTKAEIHQGSVIRSSNVK